MATISEIVIELNKPAYTFGVAAGSNGELVTALNSAKPFPTLWKAIPVDRFKALVADQWAELTADQKETVRFLLEGNSVNLGDAKVLAVMKNIFTDADVRSDLRAEAQEDDSITLNQLREAVRQIPNALVNQ